MGSPGWALHLHLSRGLIYGRPGQDGESEENKN